MCNVIVQQTVVISPGGKKTVTVLYDGPSGMWEEQWTEMVFTGCATEEKLAWWKRQGDQIVVPAVRYGEKNKVTGGQGWGRVPEGMGICPIALAREPGKNYRTWKVVTCDGGEQAEALFGNNRVPFFVSLADGKPPERQPVLIVEAGSPGCSGKTGPQLVTACNKFCAGMCDSVQFRLRNRSARRAFIHAVSQAI